MFYIVFIVWLAGLTFLIIGFLLLSSSDEKKRASPWKMTLAYLFWPITLMLVILQSLFSRRS